MKIGQTLNEVIVSSFYEAKEHHHEFVTPEHIFYSATFSDAGQKILKAIGVSVPSLNSQLKEYLSVHIPTTERNEVMQSFQFQRLMTLAAGHAASAGKKEITLSDVLVALFDCDESYVRSLIQESGISRFDVVKAIAHYDEDLGSSWNDEDLSDLEMDLIRMMEDDDDNDDDEEDDEESVIFNDEMLEEMEDDEKKMKQENIQRELPFLVCWTEMAKQGSFDPFIGRNELIKRMEQVLLRKTRHNPLLIGEPGVGKTALVEGFTQLLARDDVPKPLQGLELYRLDVAALIAGTKYRGDFEKRMTKVIKALKKMDNVIVFIDEFHNIVGAGAVSGGNIDAASMLKPLLSRGNIKFIGATTNKELRKHLENDPALIRRFQKIAVPEPDRNETKHILNGIIPRFAEHHAVRYDDSAIDAAIDLSARYIADRFFPDKAIDVIDETGAANRMKARKKRLLTEKEIATTISLMTGIPVKTMSGKEVVQLKRLYETLSSRIFGQDDAVSTVVSVVKRARAGFSNPDKPAASLLFVGPTGVGKTALARELATSLGIPLIRFDMSEYQEKHSVSKLFGSPPGYVGYEEGGMLTDKIRTHSHSVLLLDEIEKAHSDIFNSLLQIMDYGILTDSKGKKADFRNVIIIMTSNAGARDAARQALGFGKPNHVKDKTRDAVIRIFSPEFRNRLDKIVTFSALSPKTMKDIVRKFVNELAARLKAENGVTINVTPTAIAYLAKKAYSDEFGAREAERLISNEFERLLLDRILFGDIKKGEKVRISIKKEKLFLHS